ncbi:hypothetical protein Pcinc_041609 [Petrolisthes cinctipes]|uniref:Uncharacterized protein n=1 Tax=Petrolisthes cinctipes TaxID=88211 RepID=A0AAE1EJL9_PETCI|nr:hypothetical protein Pcinc_041609 [Petrolisthes cinctipes]
MSDVDGVHAMMACSDNMSTFSSTSPHCLVLPSTPTRLTLPSTPYSIASRPPATPTLTTFHRVLRLATTLS